MCVRLSVGVGRHRLLRQCPFRWGLRDGKHASLWDSCDGREDHGPRFSGATAKGRRSTCQKSIRPCRTATTAAWHLLLAFSFVTAFFRWKFTVTSFGPRIREVSPLPPNADRSAPGLSDLGHPGRNAVSATCNPWNKSSKRTVGEINGRPLSSKIGVVTEKYDQSPASDVSPIDIQYKCRCQISIVH